MASSYNGNDYIHGNAYIEGDLGNGRNVSNYGYEIISSRHMKAFKIYPGTNDEYIQSMYITSGGGTRNSNKEADKHTQQRNILVPNYGEMNRGENKGLIIKHQLAVQILEPKKSFKYYNKLWHYKLILKYIQYLNFRDKFPSNSSKTFDLSIDIDTSNIKSWRQLMRKDDIEKKISNLISILEFFNVPEELYISLIERHNTKINGYSFWLNIIGDEFCGNMITYIENLVRHYENGKDINFISVTPHPVHPETTQIGEINKGIRFISRDGGIRLISRAVYNDAFNSYIRLKSRPDLYYDELSLITDKNIAEELNNSPLVKIDGSIAHPGPFKNNTETVSSSNVARPAASNNIANTTSNKPNVLSKAVSTNSNGNKTRKTSRNSNSKTKSNTRNVSRSRSRNRKNNNESRSTRRTRAKGTQKNSRSNENSPRGRSQSRRRSKRLAGK